MSAAPERITLRVQANGAVAIRQAVKVVGQVDGLLDVSVATAATDLFKGIALEAAADNEIFTICIQGKCEAIANTTITAGTHDCLTMAADGELTPYAVADRPVAYFLGSKKGTATAAANDVIEVLVNPAPIDTIV